MYKVTWNGKYPMLYNLRQYLQRVRGDGGAHVGEPGEHGAAGGAAGLRAGLPRLRHVRAAREGAHHRPVRALPDGPRPSHL